MNIDITTTAGDAINNIVFVNGVVQTFRIKNLEAAAKTVKLFLMCSDDKDASTGSNQEGKELVSEAWGYARELPAGAFAAFGIPTFTDALTDIGTNAMTLAVSASSYKDVEIKIVLPASPETSGVCRFSLKAVAINA
jgi:hypothetical protein